MTQDQMDIIEGVILDLRAMIAAPHFGTTEQQTKLEDIADTLELMLRNQ